MGRLGREKRENKAVSGRETIRKLEREIRESRIGEDKRERKREREKKAVSGQESEGKSEKETERHIGERDRGIGGRDIAHQRKRQHIEGRDIAHRRERQRGTSERETERHIGERDREASERERERESLKKKTPTPPFIYPKSRIITGPKKSYLSSQREQKKTKKPHLSSNSTK